MELDARKEAANLFNATWDLIDKGDDRTREDDAEMLHKAHASRYLWGLVGTPLNVGRGEWQVSHVYALLGMGQPALLHGKIALDIAERENLGGIDLPFGHECVSRAYAVSGDVEKAREHKAKGLEACKAIDEQGERDYVEGELNNIAC